MQVTLCKLNLVYIHQFIGLQDGVAFELYWAEFDHNDIERKTQGQFVNKGVK